MNKYKLVEIFCNIFLLKKCHITSGNYSCSVIFDLLEWANLTRIRNSNERIDF